MKKLLLLGGSAQQVIAIETAKRLGYYTVLCDFLPDNPGQYVADRFYLVSTTDKEAVLEVAKKEMVDGVLAYASDPAAPTAAYVAEEMGLPGNPYQSVNVLCNKDLFRKFLQENGFHAPKANGYESRHAAIEEMENYRFPIIVKPVDSSGSKGVTVLHSADKLEEALDHAFSFSRNKRIIVEEYIEKKHPYLIGGDIFVQNGKVILWGLLNCHRDAMVNPLVPVGKSYPPELDETDLAQVKETLQSLVDKLHIRSGAMNVELIVDASGRVWPVDVGPRSGGNMIPDLLGMIFHTDIVEMTVQSAMGYPIQLCDGESEPYFATHNLHSRNDGIFQGIRFSPKLEQKIIRKCIYKVPGDPVFYFDNAAKAIGIIFLHFESSEDMKNSLSSIAEEIDIILN